MADCKQNPFIEHGFDRQTSHMEGEYLCTCESRVYDPNSDLESEMQDALQYYNVFGDFDGVQLDLMINLINSVRWEIDNEAK